METILIADDHEIVRRGIRTIAESFSRQYNFIEVSNCAAVMEALAGRQIHHAVLDMLLIDGNLFSSIERITEYSKSTNILVYSMNAEKIYARRLIQKGVRGFVSKQASIAELEAAIRSLLNGEVYISESLREILASQDKPDCIDNPIDLLSDRELEVVEYLSVGMGAKEIAGKIDLDITTISTYRRRAFEKLGVQNIIELKDKFLFYKMSG